MDAYFADQHLAWRSPMRGVNSFVARWWIWACNRPVVAMLVLSLVVAGMAGCEADDGTPRYDGWSARQWTTAVRVGSQRDINTLAAAFLNIQEQQAKLRRESPGIEFEDPVDLLLAKPGTESTEEAIALLLAYLEPGVDPARVAKAPRGRRVCMKSQKDCIFEYIMRRLRFSKKEQEFEGFAGKALQVLSLGRSDVVAKAAKVICEDPELPEEAVMVYLKQHPIDGLKVIDDVWRPMGGACDIPSGPLLTWLEHSLAVMQIVDTCPSHPNAPGTDQIDLLQLRLGHEVTRRLWQLDDDCWNGADCNFDPVSRGCESPECPLLAAKLLDARQLLTRINEISEDGCQSDDWESVIQAASIATRLTHLGPECRAKTQHLLSKISESPNSLLPVPGSPGGQLSSELIERLVRLSFESADSMPPEKLRRIVAELALRSDGASRESAMTFLKNNGPQNNEGEKQSAKADVAVMLQKVLSGDEPSLAKTTRGTIEELEESGPTDNEQNESASNKISGSDLLLALLEQNVRFRSENPIAIAKNISSQALIYDTLWAIGADENICNETFPCDYHCRQPLWFETPCQRTCECDASRTVSDLVSELQRFLDHESSRVRRAALEALVDHSFKERPKGAISGVLDASIAANPDFPPQELASADYYSLEILKAALQTHEKGSNQLRDQLILGLMHANSAVFRSMCIDGILAISPSASTRQEQRASRTEQKGHHEFETMSRRKFAHERHRNLEFRDFWARNAPENWSVSHDYEIWTSYDRHLEIEPEVLATAARRLTDGRGRVRPARRRHALGETPVPCIEDEPGCRLRRGLQPLRLFLSTAPEGLLERVLSVPGLLLPSDEVWLRQQAKKSLTEAEQSVAAILLNWTRSHNPDTLTALKMIAVTGVGESARLSALRSLLSRGADARVAYGQLDRIRLLFYEGCIGFNSGSSLCASARDVISWADEHYSNFGEDSNSLDLDWESESVLIAEWYGADGRLRSTQPKDYRTFWRHLDVGHTIPFVAGPPNRHCLDQTSDLLDLPHVVTRLTDESQLERWFGLYSLIESGMISSDIPIVKLLRASSDMDRSLAAKFVARGVVAIDDLILSEMKESLTGLESSSLTIAETLETLRELAAIAHGQTEFAELVRRVGASTESRIRAVASVALYRLVRGDSERWVEILEADLQVSERCLTEFGAAGDEIAVPECEHERNRRRVAARTLALLAVGGDLVALHALSAVDTFDLDTEVALAASLGESLAW